MDVTTLEISAGVQNTLSTPREIRNYISERGEGRTVNIDSISIRQNPQPRKIIIDFRIMPTGAEQLNLFSVSLALGEMAASQLSEGLSTAVGNQETT